MKHGPARQKSTWTKINESTALYRGPRYIHNKSVIEDTLGTEFDPSDIKTQTISLQHLQSLRDNGMKNPISMAKEDWSTWSTPGAIHLQRHTTEPPTVRQKSSTSAERT